MDGKARYSAISALESLNGNHTNGRPTTKSGFVRSLRRLKKRRKIPGMMLAVLLISRGASFWFWEMCS